MMLISIWDMRVSLATIAKFSPANAQVDLKQQYYCLFYTTEFVRKAENNGKSYPIISSDLLLKNLHFQTPADRVLFDEDSTSPACYRHCIKQLLLESF